MKSGYFIREYDLWRETLTQNPDTGEMVETYSKIDSILGRAYPGSTKGMIQSGRDVGAVIWTFACAADEDVTEGDEIHFDDRVIRVQAVAVTSRGDRIECRCQEVR